jgi:hypothetical protein
MERYEELKAVLKDIKEPKKSFILSLLKDFVKLEADLNELSTAQEYIINPNNPREQVILPIHKVIHDKQAQKNDIATKILRSLDNEIAEDSPFIKALTAFEEKFSK